MINDQFIKKKMGHGSETLMKMMLKMTPLGQHFL